MHHRLHLASSSLLPRFMENFNNAHKSQDLNLLYKRLKKAKVVFFFLRLLYKKNTSQQFVQLFKFHTV
jgi:hypothetical protein